MQSANEDTDGIMCRGEPEQLAGGPAVPVHGLNLS